jgi:hypothetical protein
MDRHPEGWHVGMMVFVVIDKDRNRVSTFYEAITKIGRKWITIGEGYKPYRFDAETLFLDGGDYSSPGRVYASERDYLESTERQKAWGEFYRRLSYECPEHLTLDDIQAIAANVFP